MTKQEKFIELIGSNAIKYNEKYDIKCVSVVIAQAILESGWGKSSLARKYNNYFGLKCGSTWKGKSVNLATKEEYTKGTYTDIRANFRVYDSVEDGVKGYFDFINTSRYKNLKGVTDYKTYIKNLKVDGYATSSSYVDNLTKLVEKYKLTTWDKKKTVKYFAKPNYNGYSLVDALKAIKVDSSFSYRRKIARVNGIKIYVGSALQNKKMLALLKKGTLKKP